jgi:hypothetical protein
MRADQPVPEGPRGPVLINSHLREDTTPTTTAAAARARPTTRTRIYGAIVARGRMQLWGEIQTLLASALEPQPIRLLELWFADARRSYGDS